MPPKYIQNAEDFAHIIRFGATIEDLFLDFKQDIEDLNVPDGVPDRSHRRQRAQKELCRDLAQFANSEGGCLVIGVKEKRNAEGMKVAEEVLPVATPDDMRAWIEQAITNYCVPSTFEKYLHIINTAHGPIISINVLPSLHTIYVYDRSNWAIEVLRRTSHGKKYLNPDELERHIMNGARAAKLSLERARTASSGDTVVLGDAIMYRALKAWSPLKVYAELVAIHDMSFTLNISSGKPKIQKELCVPYELVRACWVDSMHQLNILLSTNVIWNGGSFRFVEHML